MFSKQSLKEVWHLSYASSYSWGIQTASPLSFFAQSSSFSLFQICLLVIWLHVLPLQGKRSPTEWPLDLKKLGFKFVFICWQLILKESLEDESCSFLGRKWRRKYLTPISDFVPVVFLGKKKSSPLVQCVHFEAMSQSWPGGFLCRQRESFTPMWHPLEVPEHPYPCWLEKEPTNCKQVGRTVSFSALKLSGACP